MTPRAARLLVSLAAGLVFGFGLSLSGMLDPARIQGFLDPFGRWDPSLAFVLAGAVSVAFVGVHLAGRLRRPLLEGAFQLPAEGRIDAPLILGSALFGLGWGLGGFCPGPAMASLSLGLWPTWLFVASMVAGMVVHDRLFAPGCAAKRPLSRPVPDDALSPDRPSS
jgi:uncharacterized membrane protein YedE/YeeE